MTHQFPDILVTLCDPRAIGLSCVHRLTGRHGAIEVVIIGITGGEIVPKLVRVGWLGGGFCRVHVETFLAEFDLARDAAPAGTVSIESARAVRLSQKVRGWL